MNQKIVTVNVIGTDISKSGELSVELVRDAMFLAQNHGLNSGIVVINHENKMDFIRLMIDQRMNMISSEVGKMQSFSMFGVEVFVSNPSGGGVQPSKNKILILSSNPPKGSCNYVSEKVCRRCMKDRRLSGFAFDALWKNGIVSCDDGLLKFASRGLPYDGAGVSLPDCRYQLEQEMACQGVGVYHEN